LSLWLEHLEAGKCPAAVDLLYPAADTPRRSYFTDSLKHELFTPVRL